MYICFILSYGTVEIFKYDVIGQWILSKLLLNVNLNICKRGSNVKSLHCNYKGLKTVFLKILEPYSVQLLISVRRLFEFYIETCIFRLLTFGQVVRVFISPSRIRKTISIKFWSTFILSFCFSFLLQDKMIMCPRI